MMRSITLLTVLVAGTFATGAGRASAQGQPPYEQGYAHVNIGAQSGSHDLTQAGSFPLYDEEALFSNKVNIGGSVIYDLGGGYRVWGRNLYAGVSFTHDSDSTNGDVAATIPHPLYANQFRAVTGTADGLNHTENALHVQAVWRQPVTTKFDVALSLGPTIFWARQDLVAAISVAEQGAGVVLTGVTKERVNATSVGFNIGADGTYMVTDRLGAGGFLRYTGGSADFEGAAGTVKLDLGGFQIGAGLRLRF